MSADGLLDINVLVAVLAEAHQYHAASLALFSESLRATFVVASHSYCEVYSTLTRGGVSGPIGFRADEAWAALESLRAIITLVGLTAARTFEAVGLYARGGGIGPRLYDRLIGEVAIAHEIPTIVTWNVGHMRGLFPDLGVMTPEDFLAAASVA